MVMVIWQIGEFAENCPILNSPNIAPLHYACAIVMGRRQISCYNNYGSFTVCRLAGKSHVIV